MANLPKFSAEESVGVLTNGLGMVRRPRASAQPVAVAYQTAGRIVLVSSPWTAVHAAAGELESYESDVEPEPTAHALNADAYGVPAGMTSGAAVEEYELPDAAAEANAPLGAEARADAADLAEYELPDAASGAMPDAIDAAAGGPADPPMNGTDASLTELVEPEPGATE